MHQSSGPQPAALSSADESIHSRPLEAPDTWQENCFVMGYDSDSDVCVYFHVERLLDRVEIKAAAGRGGAIVWEDSHDNVWPEVVVPYEDLRLGWKGARLGLDLELRSELPAIDHAAALELMGLPGAERDHYEAVGRIAGTVTVDDATLDIGGLFWRDHTWGAREYQQFGTSWWWPTCLDNGRAYVGGVAVEVGDRALGYGLIADEDGVGVASEVSVEVEGQATPGGYTGTTIRFTPAGREPVELRSTTHHHLCTTFPGFGVERRWNDAFSACEWGDRRGFGSIELGA